MMGACFECLVQIDGVPSRQSCMVTVRDGMRIRSQEGARSAAGCRQTAVERCCARDFSISWKPRNGKKIFYGSMTRHPASPDSSQITTLRWCIAAHAAKRLRRTNATTALR
jgi:hypothetical protein